MILCIIMHMQSEVNASHCYTIDHAEEHRPDEEHEVFVISFTDTCTQPWAMMIKSLDASPTKATMYGSRGPVDFTFITILNPCDSSIEHIEILVL